MCGWVTGCVCFEICVCVESIFNKICVPKKCRWVICVLCEICVCVLKELFERARSCPCLRC